MHWEEEEIVHLMFSDIARQISIHGLKFPLLNLPYCFYLPNVWKLLCIIFKDFHKPSPASPQLLLSSLLFSNLTLQPCLLSHLWPDSHFFFPQFFFPISLSLNPIHPSHVRKESFLLEVSPESANIAQMSFPSASIASFLLITLCCSCQFTVFPPMK